MLQTAGDIAGWIAPAATAIAAMMTAANLGARFTGWGFVVFTAGSIAWTLVGLATGQPNLMLTNGFLLIVNLVGVWRWLGRQAKYEDGGRHAAERSRRKPVHDLFAAGSLAGAKVTGRGGAALGSVVDAMLRAEGRDLAYVVVSQSGSGLGERLRALDPARLTFADGEVGADLTEAEFERLPLLKADAWPEALPKAAMDEPAPLNPARSSSQA